LRYALLALPPIAIGRIPSRHILETDHIAVCRTVSQQQVVVHCRCLIESLGDIRLAAHEIIKSRNQQLRTLVLMNDRLVDQKVAVGCLVDGT
jgi:hypothetical protein